MSFEHYSEEHGLDAETLLDAARKDAAEVPGHEAGQTNANGNESKLAEAHPETIDSAK